MVVCPDGLVEIKAKAYIKIGNKVIKTPNILSININRSRGKAVSSASVQFTYDRNDGPITTDGGTKIKISMYTLSSVVFVGIIKKMSVSPSFRVAGEMIIRIQAEDFMHRLVNKRYTRRQKSRGLGPIVFISSIYKRTSLGYDDPSDVHDIDRGNSDIETFVFGPNTADQTQFLQGGETNTVGDLHPLTKVADPFKEYGGAGTAGGIALHDHTSLDLGVHGGGPAAAVFGIK